MSNASESEVVHEAPPSTADSEPALRDLVSRADLLDVRVAKWHAELLTDSAVEVGELEVRVESAWRLRGDGFETRFNVDAPLASPSGEDQVASIQVNIIANFSLSEGEKPNRALMRKFIDQVAFFVVMPFIREGLHSLSMRIGLEPITIGLLHQGKETPQTAWQKKRGAPTARDSADAQ
ncbi:hypothetical protein ACGGAQ_23865 [Micromonospora sp. NPDC047557]|uniref:hypothetical protein n=1 Tax=Micromonospora sp. NPDC047557 TaxID=3364250 RepID=UPI00371B3521